LSVFFFCSLYCLSFSFVHCIVCLFLLFIVLSVFFFCLLCCPSFSFGHCAVCPSSIYGFRFFKIYENRQMCANVMHLTLFMILCTDLYYLRHFFPVFLLSFEHVVSIFVCFSLTPASGKSNSSSFWNKVGCTFPLSI
jgi:hypothetical protein